MGVGGDGGVADVEGDTLPAGSVCTADTCTAPSPRSMRFWLVNVTTCARPPVAVTSTSTTPSWPVNVTVIVLPKTPDTETTPAAASVDVAPSAASGRIASPGATGVSVLSTVSSPVVVSVML